MFPGTAKNNLTNQSSTDRKFLGDRAAGFPCGNFCTYFSYLVFRQFSWNTPFKRTITHIVSTCSEKQMRWVDTHTIVARMTNVIRRMRHDIVGYRPKQTMCCPQFTVQSHMPILFIGLTRTTALPYPTLSCGVNCV